MARWDHRLELGDLFAHAVDADDDTVEAIRQEVADRIERAPFYDKDELTWIVDDIRDAQDAEEFDRAFDAFYDWADDHRVWVETITTREESTP